MKIELTPDDIKRFTQKGNSIHSYHSKPVVFDIDEFNKLSDSDKIFWLNYLNDHGLVSPYDVHKENQDKLKRKLEEECRQPVDLINDYILGQSWS